MTNTQVLLQRKEVVKAYQAGSITQEEARHMLEELKTESHRDVFTFYQPDNENRKLREQVITDYNNGHITKSQCFDRVEPLMKTMEFNGKTKGASSNRLRRHNDAKYYVFDIIKCRINTGCIWKLPFQSEFLDFLNA